MAPRGRLKPRGAKRVTAAHKRAEERARTAVDKLELNRQTAVLAEAKAERPEGPRASEEVKAEAVELIEEALQAEVQEEVLEALPAEVQEEVSAALPEAVLEESREEVLEEPPEAVQAGRGGLEDAAGRSSRPNSKRIFRRWGRR